MKNATSTETAKRSSKVSEAWRLVNEALRLALIERLRRYDSRNHRGQYAVLMHEAADFLDRIGPLNK